VTREITSGLIVTLNGWVSGDDMITISVNATVSKQNNNSTNEAAALPTTSERVVHTQVRTPSGKPVVLSGLVKEDVNKIVRKIPLLGDIPLLGRLFRDQSDTKEKTEIVIYIVPYLSRDNETEDQDASLKFERYYHNLVRGYAK
jgi:type II secretory pathway component GspD/PulD (secretin)